MGTNDEKVQPHKKGSVIKAQLLNLSSIRVRLMLWYVVAMAMMFGAFGYLLYATVENTLQSINDSQIHGTMSQILTTYHYGNGLLHVQSAGNVKVLGNGYVLSNDDVAFITNNHGQVIQSIRTAPGVPISGVIQSSNPVNSCRVASLHVVNAASGQVTTMYRVCAAPVVLKGQQVGTLVVGQPNMYQQQSLQLLLERFFIIGPLVMLLVALVGYWLATRAMRPVRLITQTARDIEQNDLSRRLHLRRGDELGELAATFDEMLTRLERAFERQRQFTADASHELRTPLTIMNVAINQAISQKEKPENMEQALEMLEAHKQALTVIQAENDHMARLVNDLLLLARADSGQTILDKTSLDMSEVVLDTVERLAPLAAAKRVELSLGDLSEVTVSGDRKLLHSMVANLIDNALKYTANVGAQVRIACGKGTAERPGWGWIRIEDDGPGIADEHLPHLFHRFYRIDDARSSLTDESDRSSITTSSSGLGLAIVQWVARAHEGEVQVHSVLGNGTTFEIWLPLAE